MSVEPFSSSSPVTTSSPSRKTTAVAPIQRAHGRRGATVGEVPLPTRVVGASPAPTRVVGASPAPTRVVAASLAPRWVVAGSPTGGMNAVGWSPGPPAGGIRAIGMVTSALPAIPGSAVLPALPAAAAVVPAAFAVSAARRRAAIRAATVLRVRFSECS